MKEFLILNGLGDIRSEHDTEIEALEMASLMRLAPFQASPFYVARVGREYVKDAEGNWEEKYRHSLVPNIWKLPSHRVYVWLDGEENKPSGEAEPLELSAYTLKGLHKLLNLIGRAYSQAGRSVKVSIFDPSAEEWCRPSGEKIGYNEIAYAVELDVRVGSLRV